MTEIRRPQPQFVSSVFQLIYTEISRAAGTENIRREYDLYLVTMTKFVL